MKPKLIIRLVSWSNAHPVLTTLLAFLFFSAIPVIIGANEKLADSPMAWLIGTGLILVLGITWWLLLWRHSKKYITLLLIATIIAAPVKQVRAAVYGVGVVVICVGGYCVYRVVKVCQKKFPPKSNGTNSNDGFMASGEDEYAGAYEYSSIGSCWSPPELNAIGLYEDLTQNPTTFTLTITVGQYETTTGMSANNEEGTTQTWEQFQSEMAEHGLFLTGRASYQPQFAVNGIPCDSSQVPLEFDPLTGRVTQRTGGEMRRVVVERSPNLIDWSPLLQTDVGVGTRFKVIDTTREGSMFYRVQVSQP